VKEEKERGARKTSPPFGAALKNKMNVCNHIN